MKFCPGFFLALLLIWPHFLQAQLSQPARLELELEPNDEYPTLVPAGADGLLLVQYKPRDSKLSERTYSLQMYDAKLQERWTDKLAIANSFDFVGYDYNQGSVFLLFRDQKGKTDTYQLFVIDPRQAGQQKYTLENAIPLELSEFIVIDGIALMGGYVNYRPTVLYFRTKDSKYKVLPSLYDENSEMLELKSDPATRTISVLLSEKTPKRLQTISIKTFDLEGNLIFDYALKPEEGNNFLYGRTTSFSDAAVHIAGTYAPTRSKFSRGLFVATIDSKGKQTTRFFPYASLDNFFGYLPDKRQKRVKKRVSRRKDSGRAVRLNYRLLVHDVLQYDSSYVLLGEAFYPKYGNRNVLTGMDPFSPFPRPSGVEGYKYTHAVLMAFSKEGRLLWDNTFAIEDVLSYVPQKYVHVLPLADRTVLLYMYEDEIRSKVIREGEELEEPSSSSLALRYESDKISYTDEEFGGLERWYDAYVLAYGVQRIQNYNEPDVKSSRRVFFINKITYQSPVEPLGKQ